jgi:hypothetical protein
MIKSLMNVSGIQLLGNTEQSKVIGGKQAPILYSEEYPCNWIGWCCANNVCIPSGPDENGMYPVCDSL